MGWLYKQKNRDGTPGRIWWAKYYVNGRAVRESTGTERKKEAERFLKAREGRVATGQPILPRADRVRYDEVAQDLRRHYEATGTRDLGEFSYRVKHLDRFFEGRRVASIGQPEVNDYVAARRGAGAADATIRRELSTLTRMLRLAFKNGKLLRLPMLEKPKEGSPREGFFERDQYEAVRRRLPPDLQVAAALAYTFGWRMQSEVLALERRHLDLEAGTLRLDAGTTKNDDGRVVYLTPESKSLLAAQIERIRAVERRTGRIIPHRPSATASWSPRCQHPLVTMMLGEKPWE